MVKGVLFGVTYLQRFPFRDSKFTLRTMSSEEWQQTRLIGEDDDDEQIDSADDEDLDSDAAFDESDGAFRGLFFKPGSIHPPCYSMNSYVFSILEKAEK